MHSTARRHVTLAVTLLLGGILSPRAAVSQVADTSAVAQTSRWTANPSYLFSAPTGRTLGRGELLVGVRSVPSGLRHREVLGPMAQLDFGVTDRVALLAGYAFHSYGTSPEGGSVQDGEARVGASVQVGSMESPIVIRAQADLPINHWLGRELGVVELIGARQWGDARKALTAGAGWRGSRSVCRPEWQLCEEDWDGNLFALAGGYISLGDHVQLVSENYLRNGTVETLTGIRAGVSGLSVGAALGCAASGVMGFGAHCGRGVQLSASYQLGLVRGR